MPLTLKSQANRVLRLLDHGDCQQAASIACRILASYPLCVLAYRLTARAYLGLGEIGVAESLFKRILSADPEDADAYMGLGIIQRTRGSRKDALDYLFGAYELAPGNLQVRNALSEVCHTEYGPITDTFPMSRVGLARTLLRGGMLEQCLDELSVLSQHQPQRIDLWVALCEANWLSQQYTQGTLIAQQVLKLAPFCLKANLILGQIWLGNKRENEGRFCLDRAQTLDPENRWAQVVLGKYSSLPLRVAYLHWDDVNDEEPQPDYLKNIDGEELLPE